MEDYDVHFTIQIFILGQRSDERNLTTCFQSLYSLENLEDEHLKGLVKRFRGNFCLNLTCYPYFGSVHKEVKVVDDVDDVVKNVRI